MKIKFSDHSLDRIKQRKISKTLIIKVIREPEKMMGSFRDRKLFRISVRDKILEVVVVKEKGVFIIITAYYLEKNEN